MPRRKPTVKDGATFFRSYIESVEDLPVDVQKEWCYAILMKLFYGTDPYFLCSENVPTDVLKGYWKLALPNINVSISHSQSGSKGGKQTGSKTQANGKQNASKPLLEDMDKELDKDKDKDKERNTFKKPTIQEVIDYCYERKNNIDADEFLDHYTANGWMRGKTKVKDWKACVRTWEKNKKGKKTDAMTEQGLDEDYFEMMRARGAL